MQVTRPPVALPEIFERIGFKNGICETFMLLGYGFCQGSRFTQTPLLNVKLPQLKEYEKGLAHVTHVLRQLISTSKSLFSLYCRETPAGEQRAKGTLQLKFLKIPFRRLGLGQ